jgi:hypothetical protein
MSDQNIQHYLDILRSADPARRREAIIALGKSGDKRALKPLSEIYKNDPDESLRELALRAGRHIQKKVTAAVADSGTLSYERTDKPASESEGGEVPDWMRQMDEQAQQQQPRKVTTQDRTRANRLKERAMDAAVKGKMGEVVELIAEAIELNPELERDGMLMGLLAQATGMDSQKALQEVKRLLAEDKAKGKTRRSAGDETWNETINFVLEMAIWFVVLAMFVGVITFVTIDDTFWQEQKAADPSQEQQWQELEDLWEQYGVLASIIFGFIYGAVIIGASLFLSFIAWYVGFNFLDGQGFLYPFLTAMMRVVISWFAIMTIVTFFTQFFSQDSVISLYILGGSFLLGVFVTAWAIGKVHRFGTVMGCVNMAGTVVACGVLNFACGIIMSIGG